MNYFRKLVAVWVFALGTSIANATPMQFTFGIELVDSFSVTSVERVYVTLEGYTGIGEETFFTCVSPWCGGGTLLNLEFSYSGVNYSDLDDRLLYPWQSYNLDYLTLSDGDLAEMRIGVQNSSLTAWGMRYFSNPYENRVSYGGLIYSFNGSVNQLTWAPANTGGTVSLPTTLALFGIGLAGLGGSRHKKAKRTKSSD